MAELIKSFALLSFMILVPKQIANYSSGTSSTFSHVFKKKFLNYDQLCLNSQDFENMGMFNIK